MRVLDEAVLAMLNGGENLNVHDGEAPADVEAKVVSVALPYVVYIPESPIDGPALYDGSTTARDMEFDVMYVGADRNQAKAAGERAESRIRRLSPGVRFGIVRKVDASGVRRDPTYTRPGGKPLFYGVDRYAVTVS